MSPQLACLTRQQSVPKTMSFYQILGDPQSWEGAKRGLCADPRNPYWETPPHIGKHCLKVKTGSPTLAANVATSRGADPITPCV